MDKSEATSIEHLRVFGCDAYAHIPKDERQKLDSKMRKCIFLGYGKETKGYRLYDANEGKVTFSRDVKFNEGEKEEGTVTNNAPVHLIQLNFTDNCEMTSDSENCPTEQPIAKSIPRRSERERRPPDFYGVKVNVTNQSPKEPKSIEEAINS